jgi:uncharacterized protein (UPF0335 family)
MSEDIVTIGANAAAVLKQLIEAWEKLEEEKQDVAEGQKNVMSQIKGAGFDTKIVRKLIALRKMDPAEREEQEQLMDLYRSTLGM